MENVISLLEGEVFKFKLNIERHKKNKLKHIAQYYEELKIEYEKAIEVLKISSNVPVMGSGCDEDDEQWDEIEPCPTCGDIDGMVNPCCAGYDPLHYKNCGYG